jgi:hypothetical protein
MFGFLFITNLSYYFGSLSGSQSVASLPGKPANTAIFATATEHPDTERRMASTALLTVCCLSVDFLCLDLTDIFV